MEESEAKKRRVLDLEGGDELEEEEDSLSLSSGLTPSKGKKVSEHICFIHMSG